MSNDTMAPELRALVDAAEEFTCPYVTLARTLEGLAMRVQVAEWHAERLARLAGRAKFWAPLVGIHSPVCPCGTCELVRAVEAM